MPGGNTDQIHQRQVSIHRVVKVELGVLPPDFKEIFMYQSKAGALVCYYGGMEDLLRCLVETVEELSSKHMCAHNAKDQPDCHCNQQPRKHGWDGLDQNLNYQLYKGRDKDSVTYNSCKQL